MCQKISSVWKKSKSVIVLEIYLCAFGPFQQPELISMRQNSRKCDHKHFTAAYWKNISNEKEVIVYKNVLNKSKDISFVCLFFGVSFSKKAHLHLSLHICECRFLESYIQCNIKITKICAIYKKILFKEINKTSISTFYQYIVTAFMVYIQYSKILLFFVRYR